LKDFDIRIWFDGNPGNILPIYLTALKMQSVLGFGTISNVRIPLFDIDLPNFDLGTPPGGLHDFFHPSGRRHGLLPFNGLKKAILSSDSRFLSLEGIYQNINNFPTRDELDYEACFPPLALKEGGGEDELVINIRGGEVLQGISDLYPMIPVEFYRFIADKTQKKCIFYGQIDDSPYMDELRQAFPDATYIRSRGVAEDFDFIRKSRHIIPCISTFSWMASWMSNAQRIYFPIAGVLNPAQHYYGMLLPIDDPRYEFYMFPVYEALHVNDYRAYIDPVRNAWRYMSPDSLRYAIRNRTSNLDSYLTAFDTKDFLELYPDAQDEFNNYGLRGLTNTYMNRWFAEGRLPVRVDRGFYTRTYPQAASDMSEGRYKDETEHFVLCGQYQGYKPRAGI